MQGDKFLKIKERAEATKKKYSESQSQYSNFLVYGAVSYTHLRAHET